MSTIRKPKSKSGRTISAANEAQLREAITHYESAIELIKTVLDSSAPDDAVMQAWKHLARSWDAVEI